MANVLVNDSSLSAIAEAIREKNGQTATYKPAQMAGAIAAIPVGVALPELTTPAAAGDILQGKQAVDGSGNKVTGTLQCLTNDSVELTENPTIYGTEPTLEFEVESSIDGSMATLSIPAPDAKPENIVAGKSILGVNGTAKKVVTASGTITLATGSNSITITSGLTTIQAVTVLLSTNDIGTIAANTVVKVIILRNAGSDYTATNISSAQLRLTNAKGIGYTRSASGMSVSAPTTSFDDNGGNITIGADRTFGGGLTYNWTAYGWEDD